jgi:hypothetical protein
MKKFFAFVAVIFATFAAAAQLAREFRSAAFPAVSASIGSATTLTLTSSNAAFALVPNGGVGLSFQFTGTAGQTGDVTLKLGFSPDGSTVTTTDYVTVVAAANGTNWVRVFTNVPPTYAGNARYINVRTIQNASGGDIANLSLTGYTPVPPRN